MKTKNKRKPLSSNAILYMSSCLIAQLLHTQSVKDFKSGYLIVAVPTKNPLAPGVN